ncbi:hypothetical protein N7539_008722 [Penicillium diatomitis]|uniref:Reverse transcriptase n=1 Tax=Penicillium diatomitis TaxID=2819901 RepID=A0A9W9WR79_9EURO|nr:uncharacterized protein N7539_008722 [Penicillium diatomitis]KAJ5472153.1 hypothetical protein N7539_008722 [Penicillium diatomitis]
MPGHHYPGDPESSAPVVSKQSSRPRRNHQRLHTLFNACLQHGYCPTHFKDTITVVLRKPGKNDYTQPKAYRPIALLNTLGKVMETIIAN